MSSLVNVAAAAMPNGLGRPPLASGCAAPEDGAAGPAPTARRHLLLTRHGSVVQFHAGDRRLVQGGVASGQANLVVELRGDDAVLLWLEGTDARPLGDFRPGDAAAGAVGSACELRVIRAGEGCVALLLNGRLMRANRDGAMSFATGPVGAWETFLPVEEADFAWLGFIASHRWLPQFATEGDEPARGACVEDFTVQVGKTRVGVGEAIRAARAGLARGAAPKRVDLLADGWRLERWLLYNPLAYVVAYGDPRVFDCTHIALASLLGPGGWDGDVMVVGDGTHVEFAERFEPRLRERIRFATIPAHDVLDYTLARYKVADLNAIEAWQPLLYIDTDVVCDARLPRLCRAALRSDALHAFAEMPMAKYDDYYGAFLLQQDEVAFDSEELGYSSGIFAFRSAQEHRALFRAIVAVSYGYAAAAARRDIAFYDQPFFNYVLRKLGAGDAALMAEAVTFYPNHQPLLTQIAGRGFVHFAGGVGDATPKLAHMRHYAALVQAVAAAAEPDAD